MVSVLMERCYGHGVGYSHLRVEYVREMSCAGNAKETEVRGSTRPALVPRVMVMVIKLPRILIP